jgi:hypothetical protein
MFFVRSIGCRQFCENSFSSALAVGQSKLGCFSMASDYQESPIFADEFILRVEHKKVLETNSKILDLLEKSCQGQIL